jgi:hypothetical protein
MPDASMSSVMSTLPLLQSSALLKRAEPHIKSILSPNSTLRKCYHFPILPNALKAILPPVKTSKKSAILVSICHVESQGPSILFTVRSKKLKDHANEISFPGGHLEDCDAGSVVAAALRETVEELLPSYHGTQAFEKDTRDSGLSMMQRNFEENCQVLGQTEPIPSKKNFPVYPIVGSFQRILPKEVSRVFPGNEQEVSKVFAVSISKLVECEDQEPLNRLASVCNGMGPVYKTEHGTIWGLTAMVLQPILHQVLLPVFGKEDANWCNRKKNGEEERIPGLTTKRSKF